MKKIAQWVNATFNYPELYKAGFIVSIIGDNAYLTGVKLEGYDVKTTVGEILSILGNKYKIINDSETEIEKNEKVTTGYKIVKKDTSSIYATIVVKGDTNATKSIETFDFSYVLDIMKGDEVTEAEVLAADINNDGIVSTDDIDFITQFLAANPDMIEMINHQEVYMNSLPIIKNEYIYYWYDAEKVIKKLVQNGYEERITTVGALKLQKLVIKSGTTYSKLEKDINKILNTNKIYINVEDKNTEISGTNISIKVPLKLNEKEYFKSNNISLRIVVE